MKQTIFLNITSMALKKPYFLTSYFLVLAMLGCNNNSFSGVELSNKTIVLSGVIDENMANTFLIKIDSDVEKVIIKSPGGDVESAIKIAEYIYENQLDVEVVGACFSSCANYIFPAGKTKTISGIGLVAWHGNVEYFSMMNNQQNLSEEQNTILSRILDKEKKFYSEIDVNQSVSWIGKKSPFNSDDLFTMNKTDMEKFGIIDVVVSQSDLDKSIEYWSESYSIKLISPQ